MEVVNPQQSYCPAPTQRRYHARSPRSPVTSPRSISSETFGRCFTSGSTPDRSKNLMTARLSGEAPNVLPTCSRCRLTAANPCSAQESADMLRFVHRTTAGSPSVLAPSGRSVMTARFFRAPRLRARGDVRTTVHGWPLCASRTRIRHVSARLWWAIHRDRRLYPARGALVRSLPARLCSSMWESMSATRWLAVSRSARRVSAIR